MATANIIYLEGLQRNEETLVSPESLMVLFILQCCEDLNVKIVFTSQKCLKISNDAKENKSLFILSCQELFYKYEFSQIENCPKMIKACMLPAVFIENEPWVVVGLSASLRYILDAKANDASDTNHISHRLLGFRKGCLQACAEVSVWTKFCEIEVVEMLKDVYFSLNIESCEGLIIPPSIVRFEQHLECPPILHNALKRKQEFLLKVTSDKSKYEELKKMKLKDLPDLDHKYAEGIDFTLADLLLYISFSLCIFKLGNVIVFKELFPNVMKWLGILENMECVSKGKTILNGLIEKYPPILKSTELKISFPEVPKESLYKSDPNRYKPRWRSFTHQSDIEGVAKKLEGKIHKKENSFFLQNLVQKGSDQTSGIATLMESLSLQNATRKELCISTVSFDKHFEWKSFPPAVNPSNGELPLNRLERKCHQLESMAQIVISVAKDGDKIVDFCAGGGHLGILIAFLLPNCDILLVENKSTSLSKAYKRVKELNLKNVYFFQCNLDYFIGNFDIGICLHACGVATDLVMQKCFLQKASFVCCPCCYGSLNSNHILTYPRSPLFSSELQISLSDYLILGHAADQTHDEHNPKTEQGKMCMQYVDFDRLSAAQTLGYKTVLTVMNPPSCTPKNHILIGIS